MPPDAKQLLLRFSICHLHSEQLWQRSSGSRTSAAWLHCDVAVGLALGSSNGQAMVVEATASLAKELMGDSIDELLEFDKAEMDSMLKNTDRLVRDALED